MYLKFYRVLKVSKPMNGLVPLQDQAQVSPQREGAATGPRGLLLPPRTETRQAKATRVFLRGADWKRGEMVQSRQGNTGMLISTARLKGPWSIRALEVDIVPHLRPGYTTPSWNSLLSQTQTPRKHSWKYLTVQWHHLNQGISALVWYWWIKDINTFTNALLGPQLVDTKVLN